MANLEKHPLWRRIRIVLRATVAIGVFAIGLFYALYTITTTFHPYDDEGYFLLSLKHYFAGGHLYTEVFSQYGPFYFFTQKILFRLLHLPVNHEAGRLVMLICWLLSALLAGYFVYKVSKNTTLASAAGLASLWIGRALADEPGHPQQVILPLLMLACCASLTGGLGDLVLMGGIGAALSLTKINVGGFYLAALAFTLVCRFPAGRIRTIGTVLLLAYAAVFPVILMHRDVPGWASGYCLLAILCGVSTFFAGLQTTPSFPKPARDVLYVVIGVMSVTAIVVIGAMWEGVTFGTLLEAVLRAPLRHPGVFELPLWVSRRSALFGMLVFVSVASLYWFRGRRQAYSDWVNAVRCVIGLCVIGLLIKYPWSGFLNEILPYIVLLLPLGLIPIKNRLWSQSDSLPRLFITSLAATQFLQPYPVAGSQTNIAVAPVLLWAFLCVHDGASELFHLAWPKEGWLNMICSKESILGGLVVCAVPIFMFHDGALHMHYHAPPLSLPGAASLHFSKDMEDTYRVLAQDVRTNCDVLFTMPGMGSFNFWSEVPTPNGFNQSAWMKGIDLEHQQQILQILQKDAKACVIYNAGLIGFWRTTPDDLERLPLARYILYEMPKVSQRQGYEIRVSPQRNTPWIETPAPSPPDNIQR